MERVAPGGPVVRVPVLDEAHVVALLGEHGRERAVVVQVLLRGAAGDRHRHRLERATAADDVADEPRDPPEAREAALVRVEAAAEVAARLEEEPRERVGMQPVRVEEGERAQARPEPDGLPRDRDQVAEPAEVAVGEEARVTGRPGVALVAVAGRRQQRRAQGRHLAEGDEVVEQAQEARVRRVLRPVVDDEERQRLGRIAVHRRPQQRLQRPAAAEPERDEAALGRLLVVDPRGRGVAGKLDDGLLAEGAPGPERRRGVRNELRAPVQARQLEQVLDAVRVGTRPVEPPPAAASGERNAAGAAKLVQERDPAQPAAGVRVREGERLRAGARRRGGGDGHPLSVVASARDPPPSRSAMF